MATSPDGGLSGTLPQLVGHEQAMRFLLYPRVAPARQAQGRGRIGEVVPDADFEAAFADLEAQLRDELARVRRGLASEDGRALFEKRTAEFHGR